MNNDAQSMAHRAQGRDSVSHDRLLKVSILGLPLFFFTAGAAQAQQPQAAADPAKSPQAGHRRDAAQSTGRRLADVATHV
jgi:hypothetical protein